MATKDGPDCATCKYFVAGEPQVICEQGVQKYDGVCHRYPPLAIDRRAMLDPRGSGQCLTRKGQWCGEYVKLTP